MVDQIDFALLYASGNVVPKTRKLTAESMIEGYYFDPTNNPSFISLHKVTGCFNSVVQIASTYSLALFHHQLSPPLLVRIITPAELVAFAKSQQEPFQSAELNDLLSSGNPIASYAIAARLVPKSIAFLDDRKVTIEYWVDFSIMKKVPKGRVSSTPVLLFHGTSVSRTLGYFTTVIRLGRSVLSITTTYSHQPDPVSKRVDIFADMVTANRTLQQPRAGDLKRLFDYFLSSDFPHVLDALLSKPRINLTPTISLVGQNSANVSVDEIPNFDVSVFHVNKSDRQALVAAFNVMPGGRGYVDEVKHFIGAKDYGVISDEYLIERVFKHKWNRSGFLRQVGWRTYCTVKVTDEDGNESYEDALLYCSVNLDTLQQVVIDTDSNTRTDLIRMGGKASVVPVGMWVYTEGGGQYVSVDPSQADIGETTNIPWGLYTSIRVQAELSDDTQTQDFQNRAREDAYQHIAKPFANTPQQSDKEIIRPVYVRTEGVTKQVFVLGELNDVFM